MGSGVIDDLRRRLESEKTLEDCVRDAAEPEEGDGFASDLGTSKEGGRPA